jgi:hypothetical protein
MPTDAEREGKQLLSILDFGGQCAYYACHQVYLSRRAFYLLVLNMAKSFNEKVDRSLCEQEGTMFTDWTYGGKLQKQHTHYIREYSASESNLHVLLTLDSKHKITNQP